MKTTKIVLFILLVLSWAIILIAPRELLAIVTPFQGDIIITIGIFAILVIVAIASIAFRDTSTAILTILLVTTWALVFFYYNGIEMIARPLRLWDF